LLGFFEAHCCLLKLGQIVSETGTLGLGCSTGAPRASLRKLGHSVVAVVGGTIFLIKLGSSG
jgi:hypothetical protein